MMPSSICGNSAGDRHSAVSTALWRKLKRTSAIASAVPANVPSTVTTAATSSECPAASRKSALRARLRYQSSVTPSKGRTRWRPARTEKAMSATIGT